MPQRRMRRWSQKRRSVQTIWFSYLLIYYRFTSISIFYFFSAPVGRYRNIHWMFLHPFGYSEGVAPVPWVAPTPRRLHLRLFRGRCPRLVDFAPSGRFGIVIYTRALPPSIPFCPVGAFSPLPLVAIETSTGCFFTPSVIPRALPPVSRFCPFRAFSPPR